MSEPEKIQDIEGLILLVRQQFTEVNLFLVQLEERLRACNELDQMQEAQILNLKTRLEALEKTSS